MSVKSEVQVVVCNPVFLLGFSQASVPMYNKELANRILAKLGELFPNSASSADLKEFLVPGFENLPTSDWLAAIDALLKLGFITGADLREGEGSILVDAADLSLTARGQEELRREAYARSAFFEPSGMAAGATRRKSQGVTEGDMQAQPRGAAAATWDAIEISFLSDERVQIRNGAKTETRNYAEFGFEDGRSGKPNRAWETLRALAEQGGIIRDTAKTGRTWPKVEKRMQEIRKVLREHFGISADPIPFVEGTGYQARFKINCRPSFHT